MTEASLRACLRLLVPLFLLALCRCEAHPSFDCHLTMVARVPLQVQDHLLVVPAGINGHWVSLVVDTGAQRTILSQTVADHLGLRHDARHITASLGVGGNTMVSDATIDRLVFGGVHFPVSRLAVGGLNLHTPGGLDADGLLGADILLAFDLDVDVPAGKLTLYDAGLCPDRRPPWLETPFEIIGVRAHDSRLLLPFELDGIRGMASLDTGSQGNLLAATMAARLGLNDHAFAADPTTHARGIGPNDTVAHLHRFGLMRIGPAELADPVLTVLPKNAGDWDALIGQAFFQGRRIWISFRNRQVFVTRPLPQP